MEITFKISAEQKASFILEIKKALKEELLENKSDHKIEIQDEEFLNRQDACKLLRCSKATLYNYQISNKLPYLKIGRKVLFKKSDIISALKQIGRRNQV